MTTTALCRRTLVLASATLAPVLCGLGLLTVAPAGAAGGLLGTWRNWEARVYETPDGATRCAGRAFHPAILDGEVFWIFNPKLEARPEGFLAIDPRLATPGSDVTVIVDDGGRWALREAGNGWFYNDPASAEALYRAMRQGLEMTVAIGGPAQSRRIEVPLTGFTRATEAAAEACDMAAALP